MFGEVAERFKALVLKTSDTAMYRGFESHPLRHTDRFAARNFIPCSFLYLGIKNKGLSHLMFFIKATAYFCADYSFICNHKS